MALQLRPKCIIFRNPSFVHLFSSSSDNNDGEDKKDQSSSLYRRLSQKHPHDIPSFSLSKPTKVASVDEIRKVLSEFRSRSAPHLPDQKPSSSKMVSFQELYKRNVTASGGISKVSCDTIREKSSLREIEEKELESRSVGLSLKDLRSSLRKLTFDTEDKSKKSPLQRLDILGHLGGTPNYMLAPPKEQLVEKFFHPDNMSSAEKLKLELKKVRDEFKMSESDCGSLRVQGMASENQPLPKPRIVNGKIFWTTEMDECMLGVFLEHLAQGRKTPQGWKNSTLFNAIKEAMIENLQIDVGRNHIENRVKTMRGRALAFKNLKSSFSGFGWDSETGRLTADEMVWEEAIKANSDVKRYRKVYWPHLMEWVDILGDNVAVGNIQKTAATADEDADVGDRVDLSGQHTSDPLLGAHYTPDPLLGTQFDDISLGDEVGTNNSPASVTSLDSEKTNKLFPRKRKTSATALKEEIGRMHGAIENVADAIKERNQCEKERTQYDDMIWDKIANAIYTIEDIDEDTKVEASELFAGDGVENLKRHFLRIPVHKRKEWILNKLDYGNKE